MKKLLLPMLLLSVFCGCVDDIHVTEEILDPVKQEPIIEASTTIIKRLYYSSQIDKAIDFHGRYIFGGNGIVVTDQNLNGSSTYPQNMNVRRMINYKDEMVCLCTDNGIFKLDRNFNLSKVLDLPCSDMEVDLDGKIFFVSALGTLSKERQIPANILTLDLNNRNYGIYSNPQDSIGTFLNQIEILENGDIFALGSNGTIYEYNQQNLKSKHSSENVVHMPEGINGISNGHEIKAIGNELYYIFPHVDKKLLKYTSHWEAILDIGYIENYNSPAEKDKEIVMGYFNSLNVVGDNILIGAQYGALKIDLSTHEYDFFKDPQFPNQFIQSIHATSTGDVIVILAGNNVVKYSNGQ